jgi:dihydroflavonol-4-reductase
MTCDEVLVTGGSGFVGRHLVSALVARGARVRILDVRPPKDLPPEVQYTRGSACDPRTVDAALAGVAEVYHLAALPGMWAAKRQDFDIANRLATKVLLAAARKHAVARFLHCSTESILLGRATSENEVNEEVETRADEMAGLYTRSKKAAEELALRAAAEGAPVVIANPTMPIGPHDYALTPPTAMIQYFMHRPIQLYVDAVLNIVDVRDVAAGLILVMQRGRIGERYILGGQNVRLRHLLAIISDLTGRKTLRARLPMPVATATAAIMEFIAERTNRPPAATVEGVEIARRSRPLSSDKARAELGYEARSLRDALADTVRWLQHGPEVRRQPFALNSARGRSAGRARPALWQRRTSGR